MIGCLILAGGVLLTYAVFRLVCGLGVRDAATAAWVTLYAFVFAVTEALSLGQLLGGRGIAAAWCIWIVVAGLMLVFKRARANDAIMRERGAWQRGWRACQSVNPVVTWVSLALLVLTASHALLAPPFEVDSLSYHLPRVQHWLVNGSVRFYETAIARQNFQPPGYSFVVCHLVALMATDRWLNFIQWGAYVVSAGVVSLIARELGARLRGQLLAGVFALALPAAISQSFSCVNDQFAAVPVLVFALALMRLGHAGRSRMWWAFAASVAMGLALLAKWTSIIYIAAFALPITIVLVAREWRQEKGGGAVRFLVILAFVSMGGLLFITPHCVRNVRAYGDPLSGDPPGMLTNIRLTPEKLAVNIVKHAAIHLAAPYRPFNYPLEHAVVRFSGELLNDPDITYESAINDTKFRMITPLGRATAWASNPVHFVLFVLIGAVWLFRWNRNADLQMLVGIPVLAGALLYCMLFKWQPWAARLQIPLFLLMGAGAGVWLERCDGNRLFQHGILIVVMGYAVLHALLRPTWYLPAFLYGQGRDGSGITQGMTVSEKLWALTRRGWPKEDLRHMNATATPDVTHGYSLFFTSRDRQYLGNETYLVKATEYACLKELMAFLCREDLVREYSSSVGLLISSDNGNIPPEETVRPYSSEYLFWALAGNLTGRGHLQFQHFGLSDPERLCADYFGQRAGLVISDKTRERVLTRLQETRAVKCEMSNCFFNVFSVQTTLRKRATSL